MENEFKVMDMFSKLVDLLILNFLFVITSLPVITLGASLTALYSVNLKLTKNEESYIIKDYFRSFCGNFKLATLSFLTFAAAAGLLGANIWISYQNSGYFFMVLRALGTVFLAVLFICFLYFYPILARFCFSLRQVWVHIPHMIVTQAGYFFLLLAMNIPVLFLCFYSVYTAFFVLVLACVLGFSLFTYAESFLFRKIFVSYERA